jgi:Tuberculosis necrotizing toxin
MGIELPPELADVAAQAGVAWPEADEEAMAKQAQAWRDTATSMSTLATDADTTAGGALSTMKGDTATAASTEWKQFVEPDSGHLTSVVKDANAAADRLEHAANQVGTAKVEIVRNLVGLAQNQDAANAAAQAGHPMALAGLDTAVRGTAANVSHIQNQLVAAVQPTSGVDIAAVRNPVNANPGHHLLPGVTTDAVTHTVTDTVTLAHHTTEGATSTLAQPDGTGAVPNPASHGGATDLLRSTTGAVADTAGQLPGAIDHTTGAVTGHGPGGATDFLRSTTGAVADTAGQLPGVVDHTTGAVTGHGPSATDLLRGTTGAVADTTGHLPGAVDQVAGTVSDTVGHVPGAVTQVTGTVADAGGHLPGAVNQVGDTAGHLPGAVNQLPGTVGDTVANVPGVVNQATNTLDQLPGAVGDTVSGVPGTVGNLPGPNDLLPGHQGGPNTAIPDLHPGDPEVTGPVPAHDFPGHDAPTPPTGQTVQAGFAGGLEPAAAAVPAAPVNLPPVAAAPPLNQQAPTFGGGPGFPGTPAPASPPVIGAPAPGGQAPPAPPPAAQQARPTAIAPAAPAAPVASPAAPDQPRKQMAGPPGAPPPAKGERNEVLAAFWIHMFPIGHLPVASYRPARQVPPPPVEFDYAAGLRFPPGDHPQSHLIDATEAQPVTPSAGRTADHPTVQALLENHDPLGGINEREWDRRYLVRLGSVTAHGISPEGLEYNWPTSEQYPEGGSAEGEAEVLEEDTIIDRFGSPHGRVFAEDGTPFAQRSLPPAHKDLGYHRYQVKKPIPVWRAVSAAWFGQPGGGIRYRTTHSAAELVALGYLEEIA